MVRTRFANRAAAGPARLHLVYFALKLPAAMAREIMALGADAAGRHVSAERLHISLNPLGSFDILDPQVIAQAARAAATVQTAPFVVAMNRVVGWGQAAPYPVVLTGDDGLGGVRMLYEAIHAALAEAGLVRGPARELEPHVTLLRASQRPAPRIIAPVAWRVSEFLLIDSLYGEGRHEVLGRWPLSGTWGSE